MVGKVTPDDMISASLIPVLLGQSPYQTPNDLLRTFIDRDEGVEPEPWAGNEATHWGNVLEPVILQQAAERLDLSNVLIDYDRAIFHPTINLAASLDGSGEGAGKIKTDVSRGIYCIGADTIDISGPGVLESKATRARPEDVPPPQRGPLQLQAQMMCTGWTWGCVATLYQGLELRLFVYQSDDIVQRRISEAIDDFEMRRKNHDWYPPLTSEDANTAWSRANEDAPPLDLDGTSVIGAVADLIAAKYDLADAKDRIDDAELAIKEAMANHDVATATIGDVKYQIGWGMINRKAQPEKIVPAKPAESVRKKTLSLKEMKG